MNSIQPFSSAATFGGGTVANVTPAHLRQVMRAFLTGFAQSSRVTMRYALRRISEDLGILPESGDIEEVPWHTVNAYSLNELLFEWREKINASTIRLYMHALRGIARSCYINGLMPADQYSLLREVKLPRGQNRVGRGRAVERRYREALLASCMNDGRVHGIRDAALIAMFFASGVRRAELASLADEDLDIEAGEMRVRVKGGHVVKKYLAAWAIPFLQQWRDVRRARGRNGGPFFCRIYKGGGLSGKPLTGRGIFYLLEQRSIIAGLPYRVRPHDARRTLGTEILSEHGELIAQRVLGHANLSTTRIYDKRSDDVIKNIFSAKDK